MDAYDMIDCLTNSELRNLTLADAKNALAAFKYADEADKRELNALIWARIIKSEIESAHWRVSTKLIYDQNDNLINFDFL